MEVRNHTGCLLKLQRFPPSGELICHFSQGISPAGCKSVGSLLEKGSRSMLLPQIEVLGKVLLLPLAAASSTPTEFYVNRNNRFPPLVPNWPHVGFFSSLLLHIMKSQESQQSHHLLREESGRTGYSWKCLGEEGAGQDLIAVQQMLRWT